MKKVLLLIGLALASFSQPFALVAQEMLSKSDENSLRAGSAIHLPEGFTYANRENAATGKHLGVGMMTPDMYIAVAIELPPVEGILIKGVSYFSRTTDDHGKIFIADRTGEEAYVLRHMKSVKTVTGESVTTVEFDTPVPTVAGKVYAVGYEVKSAGKNTNDMAMSPVGYISDKRCYPEANLMTFSVGSTALGNIGQSLGIINIAPFNYGNLGIVVHYEDPQGKMARLATFDNVDLPGVYKIGKNIAVEDFKIKLPIKNWQTTPITKVAITSKKPDNSTETKEYSVNIPFMKTDTIECRGYEIAKKGRGSVKLEISSVNGGKNGVSDPNKVTTALDYVLYPEGEAVLRQKFLIERFTTEISKGCPQADSILQKASMELRKEGVEVIIAAHHAGAGGTDFLTLKPSQDLLPYAAAPSKEGFTPGFAISRLSDAALRTLDPVGNIKGMWMLPASPEIVIEQIGVAKNIPTEAIISKVEQNDKSEGIRSITVTGNILSPSAKEDVYLSIYRTEDSIPAKKQIGIPTGGKYNHNNVIRQFVTPTFGKKVTVSDNGAFSVTIDKVKVDKAWDNNKMHFVIFIHRDIKNAEPSMRYIYAAESIGVHTMTGNRQVTPELQPIAYAVEGQIQIKGDFDNFLVYDIAGRLVTKEGDAATLPAGLYVVKTRLGNVDYISKVLVK